MICPQCNEGLVVVDIKVQAAYSDMRESWPERIDISYKCNVCLKSTILPKSKYPLDVAGLRAMIQKQLNADCGEIQRRSEDAQGRSEEAQGDPCYGWHG